MTVLDMEKKEGNTPEQELALLSPNCPAVTIRFLGQTRFILLCPGAL